MKVGGENVQVEWVDERLQVVSHFLDSNKRVKVVILQLL